MPLAHLHLVEWIPSGVGDTDADCLFRAVEGPFAMKFVV